MRITVKSLPKPKVKKTKGEREFSVTKDYTFNLIIDGESRSFTIGKGYIFDGKSSPKPIEAITLGRIRWDDTHYFEEVVVHDWLYDNFGFAYDDKGNKFKYKRKDADKIYRKIMEHMGRSWARCWAEYSAVRIGGGGAWYG